MAAILTVRGPRRGSTRGDTLVRGLEELGFVVSESPTAWRSLKSLRSNGHGRGSVRCVYLAEFSHRQLVPAYLLSRALGVPLVTDLHVSLVESALDDHRRLHRLSPALWFRWLVDKSQMAMSDRVIVDTRAHRSYFARLLRASESDMTVIYGGAAHWIFSSTPLPPAQPTRVLFYGNPVPLHGFHVIVGAARLCEEVAQDIEFLVIGRTADDPAFSGAAVPSNMRLAPRATLDGLAEAIRGSHICLGVFGTTGKAERVIPNKVWQCLHAGRPVITRDGEGPREVLRGGNDCVLIPPGRADRLADEIVALSGDGPRRDALGAQGHKRAVEFGRDVAARGFVALLNGTGATIGRESDPSPSPDRTER